MDIDRKFKIEAVCVAHGDVFTEEDGVFFKAGDAAFNRSVMDAYKREALRFNAHPRQIAGIDLLTERIEQYKLAHPSKVKVPDVDEGREEQIVNRPNNAECLQSSPEMQS